MTLAAGRLNKRVRLESPTGGERDSGSGAVITSWADEGDRWAAIEPLSVRDFIAADQHQSKVTHRIVMRRHASLRADWRLVHIASGTVYTIAGILPDAESGIEYVTLAASDGVITAPE